MVALLLVSHLLNGGGEDLDSRCIGRLASKTVSKRWENNGGTDLRWARVWGKRVPLES